MANPAFSVMERFERQSNPPRGLIDGSGGGGDDDGMDARISALESAHFETRDRLTRIETRLGSVALKADLVGLCGDMQSMRVAFHQELNAQTWKLVTFVCSFGTALVGATYFIAQHAS